MARFWRGKSHFQTLNSLSSFELNKSLWSWRGVHHCLTVPWRVNNQLVTILGGGDFWGYGRDFGAARKDLLDGFKLVESGLEFLTEELVFLGELVVGLECGGVGGVSGIGVGVVEKEGR